MAETSSIEWTDATWNPVTGCSVVSPGCTNCYAMKLAGTRLQHHASRAGLTRPTKAGPVWTGEVRLNEDWLTQPLKWRRPRRIFVCAHGDLFHESVPDELIDRVFAVMALAPQHSFQVLTKRADRMREYLTRPAVEVRAGLEALGLVMQSALGVGPKKLGDGVKIRGSDINPGALVAWPLPNVWLGVSVEDQARADERIPHLLATPAAVRFLSCEPLLGPVEIRQFMWPVCKSMPATFRTWAEAEAAGQLTYTRQALVAADSTFLDWIIAGGESGPGARPMHPDWVRSLRDQGAAAGVPFFFKHWGGWFPSDEPVLGAKGWRIVGGQGFSNVGKKAAGRRLDGTAHDALPLQSTTLERNP